MSRETVYDLWAAEEAGYRAGLRAGARAAGASLKAENAQLRARSRAAESALRLLSDEMAYVLSNPLTAGDLARARGVLLAARGVLEHGAEPPADLGMGTGWAPSQGGSLPDNSGQGDSGPRRPR